ncbi:MAG: tetratricopeptide repeat protein [Syntrophaceae bacterium]|nr:tetratricopeptide repeat protein [Syntrophaceae bacterium]
MDEAELLLNQGRFDEARRLADENLARLPSDIEGKIILCRALLGMNALEEAGEQLHEIDPWIQWAVRIYLDAGDAFARGGRLDEATRFYKIFLSLNPDAPRADEIAGRIGHASDPKRDWELGPDSRYERVEDIDRQFWTVTLADLYTRQGHLDMARGVLEEILRREPDHEEARIRIAALPGEDVQPNAASRIRLAGELARWLRNIGRMKSHGA